MHWISFIGFFIIINICQSQSTTFKHFETGNGNKGGTFQVAPSGNHAGMSELKNSADGTVHTTTSNVPSENSMKHEKDGRNIFKYVANSANNNYCCIVLPFIIAALMTIIHF